MNNASKYIKTDNGYIKKDIIVALYIVTGAEDYATIIQAPDNTKLKYRTNSSLADAQTTLLEAFNLINSSF